MRKPGHSTHWQGYDLQQTIVIGVVSLRRTPDSPAATSVVGQWSEMVSKIRSYIKRETKLRDAKLHEEAAEDSVAAGLMVTVSGKSTTLTVHQPQLLVFILIGQISTSCL